MYKNIKPYFINLEQRSLWTGWLGLNINLELKYVDNVVCQIRFYYDTK